MDFKTYQKEASKTIQKYIDDKEKNKVIPFLGIVGEVGSVISELKKNLRDGSHYTKYEQRLSEELGDLLWYIAAIASQNDISLVKIAEGNLKKVKDRFGEQDPSLFKIYDEKYPKEEQFPREFEITFVASEKGKKTVKIINSATGKQLGNTISDNAHREDGYRFHDIFHFGYVAILGWSPVVRKFLKIKRKSDENTDENEDGARAAIIEELISLFIFNHALDHDLFRYSNSVDTEVLKSVQKLVSGIEVRDCTAKQWEMAIINSYKVYDELKQNNGGRVLVSIKNRRLTYLGKN